MYLWLKFAHITTVVLSGTLFAVRGIAMIQEARWVRQPVVRVAPHVIDTLLLLTGAGLIMVTAQYPLVQAWISVKLVLVVVYIALGMIALKHGRSRHQRVAAWLAALLVFAWIVFIAVHKQVLPG